MTEQPPNEMSQSPERGRQVRSRRPTATKGRLAGAAAMLTHGVAIGSRHHWHSGLDSRHTRPHRSTPWRFATPCYSHAVEGLTFSGANHALQRTPGFGVQLPGAALIRPAPVTACAPAIKPGTGRAFACAAVLTADHRLRVRVRFFHCSITSSDGGLLCDSGTLACPGSESKYLR